MSMKMPSNSAQCTEIHTICPEHGMFVSKHWALPSGQVISTPCPACMKAREEAMPEEARQIEFRKIQKASGIKPRYYNASLKNWIPDGYEGMDARHALREYVDNFSKESANVLLYGKPSCGKTHVACALVTELLRKGFTAQYVSVMELFSGFRDTVIKGNEREEDFYARMRAPDLLVLDDIGLFLMEEQEEKILYRIIDDRYNSVVPTVLSGRIDPDCLDRDIGPSCAKRFFDNTAVAISLNGGMSL